MNGFVLYVTIMVLVGVYMLHQLEVVLVRYQAIHLLPLDRQMVVLETAMILVILVVTVVGETQVMMVVEEVTQVTLVVEEEALVTLAVEEALEEVTAAQITVRRHFQKVESILFLDQNLKEIKTPKIIL